MSPFPISLFAILSVAACTPVGSHEPPPAGADSGDSGENAAGGKPQMTGGPMQAEEQIRVAAGLEDTSCNADAAQGYVGQKSERRVVESAVKASGATSVRVIEPDMMVTMDFRGDRLNIRVDETGKIIAITCG
jgi:hypothetical protein